MALLNKSQKVAILYHRLFDYQLSPAELKKWEAGPATVGQFTIFNLQFTNKFKKPNPKFSNKKLLIAKKAARLLAKIPTVKLVAITGALSMKNASSGSDIDLMIIAQANLLWTTRLLVYLVLRIMNYELRKPKEKKQGDKLCLNLWLDETALSWPKSDRNLYTAHEIAQTVPLVNKKRTYERFLAKNKWILDYWPKAVKLPQETRLLGDKNARNNLFWSILVSSLEYLCFHLQYLYMRPKITREVITSHKALFHPRDWGKVVLDRLKLG